LLIPLKEGKGGEREGDFTDNFIRWLRSHFIPSLTDLSLRSHGWTVPTIFHCIVLAAPAVLNVWPSKLKLDEEKSKNRPVLAQQNGFGPTFLQRQRARTNTWQRRRECNECDHNGAPWFWFANHNNWSRWVAISGLPTYMQLSALLLVLWVGLENSKQPNLDVWNFFAKSHTEEHCWRCS
jgi:hypothetical protein